MELIALGLGVIIGVLFFSAVINIIRFVWDVVWFAIREFLGVVRWILPVMLLTMTTPNQAQVAALGPGFYDDDVPLIEYIGGWSLSCLSGPYGGCITQTGLTTSTAFSVEFYIWGDGFTLYFTRQPTGAEMLMCVNSICSAYSHYAPSLTHQNSLTVTGLGYGTHTVTLEKTSTASTNANVDAVYVYPPAPAPPTTMDVVVEITLDPQPTPVYLHEIDIGGVASVVNYSISPLDVITVFLLAIMVIFMIIGFIVQIRR